MNDQTSLEQILIWFRETVMAMSNSELKDAIKEINEDREQISKASSRYNELSQKLGIAEEALSCRGFSTRW